MTKKISKLDVIALVIGAIIGFGSFYLPGNKFLVESGVINTAIGFALGACLILFVQSGYHVMMSHHYETGGEFSYTFVHLGKTHGFIVGWALSFCYLTLISLNATAVVLVLKQVFGNFSYGYLYTIANYPVYISDLIIAITIILLFYYINNRGLVLSMLCQKLLIMSLVIVVIVLGVVMFYKGNKEQFVHYYVTQYHFDITGILKIISIVPFIFVGFDVVPQVLTDLGFPTKSATKITISATVIGVVIYNVLNIITALAYTPKQATQLNWATGQAVLEKIGELGFIGLCIALMAAVVGGINGFLVASSRVISSLSAYGIFPKQYKTSKKALQFVVILSIVLLFLGREVILYIVDLSSLMAAITYGYVCYISTKLAHKKIEKWSSYIGVGVSGIFVILLLAPNSPSQLDTVSFIILSIWILFGSIYFYMGRERKKKDEKD